MTVHFHCKRLPNLDLGAGTGLTPSKYVRFLMDLTGESIDVCIDLYDRIVRQAMAGNFKHLLHERRGYYSCVIEVIRHSGGRRRPDVAGANNGYYSADTSEDVSATILFYEPSCNAWHLAKVTCCVERTDSTFGGNDAERWRNMAIQALS